ncbi:MAG: translocation/assembly module TamB domain-containing protein [Prevotella sp.]|nr:translocation/assembly module TamB domain-containing protein [Prevotella sp.]
MKKKLKVVIALMAAALLLLLALPLLLYVPPIQQWAVQRVAAIASEATGMQISVESVSLKFPLDLEAGGVTVVAAPTPDNPRPDTIASIGNAVVSVRLLPLFRQEVVVNGLELNQAKVNTLDLVSDVQIVGQMGRLKVDPSNISLVSGQVELGDALLADADVSVVLSDTAAIDTTDTGPIPWHIVFGQVALSNTNVNISFPGDTMRVATYFGEASANGGDIDLLSETYRVGALLWNNGRLAYDLVNEPRLERGLDYAHINMTDINLAVDSIYYHDPYTRFNFRNLAFKEQSGLTVNDLHGQLALDDKGIKTSSLSLQTPYTDIYAQADIDYTVADSVDAGQLHVLLDASVGKEDMLLFIPSEYLTPSTQRLMPNWPLALKGRVDGNLHQATLDVERMEWPTAFALQASGTVGRLDKPDSLNADVNLKAKAYNLNSLMAAFNVSSPSFRVPNGLSLEGNVQADGPRYSANLTARESSGAVRAKVHFNQPTEAYTADINVSQLNLQRFLPDVNCALEGLQCSLRGRGTDVFHKSSWIDGSATVERLTFEGRQLDSLLANLHLKEGHAMADVTSQNRLIDGTLCVDALLEGKPQQLRTTIETRLNHVDLYALQITDKPLTIGLDGDFELTSNLNNSHKLSGLMQNIWLRDTISTKHPEKLGVLLTARPDTTYARLQCGNFIVKLDASGPYDRLLTQLTTLSDTVQYQLNERIIDQPQLKRLLPTMRLYVTSGTENPLAHILKASNDIGFRDLLLDLNTSPLTGLNGKAHIYALTSGTTRIDTVGLTLKDTERGLTYQAQVTNGPRNPQMVFNTLIDGHIYERGARVGLRFFDKDGQRGLRIGASAAMEADGLRFTLMPSRPTLGYREFALNDDNYLFVGQDLKLKAKVDLIADDGTGLKIYSEDEDSLSLQDLTITLHHVDLDQLTASMPFLPRITGLLDGDYHLVMDRQHQISVAGDMQLQHLTYEGSAMGSLASEFVYLQREDETHAIDGYIMQDGRQIAALQGSYTNKKVSGGNEHLEGVLTLERAPLGLINGFVPDQLLGLEGFAEGEININGSLSRPQVDGELMLDSAFLVSQPYGVRLRFDNDPVRIQQSKLLLENFTMYAYNDNPLNIMGEIDFSNLDRMTMDVRMRAQDFMLINAKQTANSLAYGKAFVNFLARMRGPMDQLQMRGRLDVLGSTDLTYLMLDSPLSTDNQLDELVKFTDFNDTTQTVVQRPTPNGLNLDLNVSVDQGAHVKCGLNVDQTNYVDLFGGGDLRMRYTGAEGLQLTGRYTLTSGEMKYSLPVIPLKTFTIQDGSYVEFTGDPMNPTLNITATERTRASVGQEGGQSRSVAFDCGVVITKTLADMGLQFIIDAPEDMTVASELGAMSTEEKGKLAVTMLTTGMYLADGNTGGFSMNSALSSFLQSEINNITGNALKTLDLSIGMDNTTDASGQMHTDYSFKFAKRFWNNRLKVQIGGKVSTGQEVEGQNQSFFDNVTMEYRLSQTGNQYVKLFYNQNAYDWLEGYTGEYGGGFIWKRKMDSFWDIFHIWGKQTTATPIPSREGGRNGVSPRDSTATPPTGGRTERGL